MKLLKKIALLTLIFTMSISTTTYAANKQTDENIIETTGFDEMENGKGEYF